MDGLQLIIMSLYWIINCDKVPTTTDINNKSNWVLGIWVFSVLSLKLFYQSKAILKELFFKKNLLSKNIQPNHIEKYKVMSCIELILININADSHKETGSYFKNSHLYSWLLLIWLNISISHMSSLFKNSSVWGNTPHFWSSEGFNQ